MIAIADYKADEHLVDTKFKSQQSVFQKKEIKTKLEV
jgi:hypothetical protein